MAGTSELARSTDPDTSKIAARRSLEFSQNHRMNVLGVLALPGTCYDIARRTGLTAVQVDRRIHELIEERLIKVLPYTKPSPSGRPCRVYQQTTYDEQLPPNTQTDLF